MLDMTGNWLEVGDHVWHSGRECIVRKIDEKCIYLNATDGSFYCGLSDGKQVKLLKRDNTLATYYRYQGSPIVSCVTLEALLKLIVPFEDNWEEEVNVEEVNLVVDDKTKEIDEQIKIIGYVKNGNFVELK